MQAPFLRGIFLGNSFPFGVQANALTKVHLLGMKGFLLMLFSSTSLVAINCAIFSGIAIGSILNEGNDDSWTVVLSILGAFGESFRLATYQE